MNDRIFWSKWFSTVQGEQLPPVSRSRPVERRFSSLALDQRPAVREPKIRAAVAAVIDERQPLAGGHQPVGDLEGIQPDSVPGRLVVECETRGEIHRPVCVGGTLSADFDDAARMGHPVQ